MGLLQRRNRRSALADRHLMAQLLRGQLDRLACAKYGMCETPSLPKIFKAGLRTSGARVHIPRYGVPAGCARTRPGDAARWISWHRLKASEAWRMSAFRQRLNESGYVEISLHGRSPCGRGK